MSGVDLKFFSEVQVALEKEADRKDEIRIKVREFDRQVRQLAAVLNGVHADPSGPVPEIDFTEVQATLRHFAALIPGDHFHKYYDLWSRQVQQAVFLVVFRHYLVHEELVTIPVIETTLGGKILNTCTSRLAVNAVTVGDYQRPLRLSKFIKDLSAGFQMLNLKNDIIRKRFDGIKYDVKKIEEVVYDITLRGLQQNEQPNKKPKLSE
ncbi:Translin [Syncephalastrum racemosum]|uniref:Translin n=1 Tax=Syncephalastrum racemosum TaxID=13706 RepID=A0A1X2HQ87_SYNRA|nr:Translin [Syncephalastrum racemosum]